MELSPKGNITAEMPWWVYKIVCYDMESMRNTMRYLNRTYGSCYRGYVLKKAIDALPRFMRKRVTVKDEPVQLMVGRKMELVYMDEYQQEPRSI